MESDGLYKAQSWDYDAIVLDIMLPGIDGLELLERLRNTKRTPVLLLTARDTLDDRVTGLDTGADDYLVKPFALQELTARLRALSSTQRRRSGARRFPQAKSPLILPPGTSHWPESRSNSPPASTDWSNCWC